MRYFVILGRSVFIFILLLFLSNSCNLPKDEVKRPNIIIFLVDDMGLMDTSVPFILDSNANIIEQNLNHFYHTPNMEKLADQGIRFTNFYAHSVCSPTRISILSGQNSARHKTTNWILAESNNRTEFGPREWNWKGLRRQDITLARLLQNSGYHTIHIGKAHFGPKNSEGENPINLGFDINIAGNSSGHPGSYYGQDGYGLIKGQKSRAVPDLEKYHRSDLFLTEALTLEAKATINKCKERDMPFFLYMSHYAVHAPFQTDARFINNYSDKNRSEKAQAYATLIEGIDKSLGDIVQHIKELDLDKNTLILFLGDNGSDAPLPIENNYSSSSPLKGKKGNHWEGGMRVPFIASWITPDNKEICQQKLIISNNSIQQQIGTITDLFPTICKIANVEIPESYKMDGFELQNQFKSMHNEYRTESFLNHFPHGNHRSNYFSSLVSADWKVIYHYFEDEEKRYELYHLKDDPYENQNLYIQNPIKLKYMMGLLIKELEEKKALYPEKEGNIIKPLMP